MIVDQQAVRRVALSSIAASALVRSGALSTWQPQPPSSVSMPSRIVGSLSMHSTIMPASWPDRRGMSSRGGASLGSAGDSGTLTEKCEPRPSDRIDLDLVIEHARDALDDREPEAEPARDLGALIEPVEFAEDRALLRLRNADAGVVDVDAQPARRAAGSRSARGHPACI